MFLFTDAHVANKSFLELINNMLTSGMIPALYDDGEKDALIAGIREEVTTLVQHSCIHALNKSLTHSLTHVSQDQILEVCTLQSLVARLV